ALFDDRLRSGDAFRRVRRTELRVRVGTANRVEYVTAIVRDGAEDLSRHERRVHFEAIEADRAGFFARTCSACVQRLSDRLESGEILAPRDEQSGYGFRACQPQAEPLQQRPEATERHDLAAGQNQPREVRIPGTGERAEG